VFEDSYAKLKVTPHTSESIAWVFSQEFEVTNKTGQEADLYLAYVFPEKLLKGTAELWNGSQWINVTSQINYAFNGDKHYYYTTNPLTFSALETRKWRITYLPSSPQGKWELVAWTGDSGDCILDVNHASCQKVWKIDPWWSSICDYRQIAYFYNSGNGAITNFPVLIDLNSDFNFSPVGTSGDDIYFIDDDNTTILPKEKERFDKDANEANFWVLVPQIANSNTDFLSIYYGCTDTNTDDPETVWADYNAVFHLNQGAGDLNDVTDADVNLFVGGTPVYNVDSNTGFAITFDGSTDYFTGDSSDFNFGAGQFWVEAIARTSASGANRALIAKSNSAGDDYWMANQRDVGGIRGIIYDGASNTVVHNAEISDGFWHHIVFYRDASNKKVYIDGNMVSDDTSGDADVDGNLSIGRFGESDSLYWNGQVDEIRIVKGNFPFSAAYLQAVRQNVVDRNFVVFAAEEVSELTADFTYSPTAINLDTENGDTNIVVDFNDASTYASKTPDAWQWDENGTTFATDQNTSHGFTAVGDYNVCLLVTVLDGNSDQACKTLNVHQYLQDVDFNWTSNLSASDWNVTFQAQATGDVNVFTWDFNDGTTDVNQQLDHNYTGSADYNVCLTATSTDDLNKTTCHTVATHFLTVKVPLDEETGEQITPFGVSVRFQNVILDENNQTEDVNFYLANEGDYIINIDGNGEYLPRTYIQEIASSFTLQPYLVDNDEGATIVFQITETYSGESLSNIELIMKKYLSQGLTTVESVLSDSTGVATLHAIAGNEYVIEFYDNNSLLDTQTITITYVTYYVSIITTEGAAVVPTQYIIDVNFVPESGTSLPSSPYIDLYQLVTVPADILNSVRAVVTQGITTLYDVNFDGNTWTDLNIWQRIDTSNLDTNKPLNVVLTFDTRYGTRTIESQYFYFEELAYDLIPNLRALAGDFGTGFSLLIAIVCTIAAMGLTTRATAQSYTATSIIGCTILGIFWYLWFVPTEVMVFSLAATAATIILKEKI